MVDEPEISAEQALSELAKRIRDLSEGESAPSSRVSEFRAQAFAQPALKYEPSSLDLRLSAVEARLGQVDTRLAVVESKLGSVDASMTRLEAAMIRLQENARTDFRVTFGVLIATALGLATMMAKGFHWI